MSVFFILTKIIRLHRPQNESIPFPCKLYMSGGGFVVGNRIGVSFICYNGIYYLGRLSFSLMTKDQTKTYKQQIGLESCRTLELVSVCVCVCSEEVILEGIFEMKKLVN